MRIVQLATEFAPIAKAGGLGEVIVGLSRELKRLGHEVEVILPKYDFIDLQKLRNVNMEVPDFKCIEKGNVHANAMWSAECEEIVLHLLEARHPAGYFHRGKIYGCADDTARYLYFSKAAIEYLKLKEKPIDVLHLHDWHVALAAVFARDLYNLPIKSIVLSIHNAAYQGKCAPWDLDYIGLKSEKYLTKEKLQNDDPANPGLINILKGGIVYSDAVIAVSPTYSKEILTPEIGYGLDPTFRKNTMKLFGILNGLDLKLWDPGKDRFLIELYKADDPLEKIFKAKEQNRETLAQKFNLPKTSRPWFGSITRLVEQKGPELIEVAIDAALRLGGTFFLLGAAPSLKIQEHFEKLKAKCKGRAAEFHFEYDEVLAHQVYASLDFLVLPSLYEPCGLSQMIAMRYGTIPIARATGGHIDTIFDYENPKVPEKKQNGFLFPNMTPRSETEAIERAFRLFKEKPAAIQTLIKNGMAINWSWEKPAQEYLRVFNHCIRNKEIAGSW
jgi:starch synthase